MAASQASVPVSTSRGEFKMLVFSPPAGAPADKPLVLLVSGEGGWRKFDTMIAEFMRDAGYWVGGMDAMKYFWNPQDDREQLALDMRSYADALAAAAGRPAGAPLVLAGFSFGADIAPWVAGAGGWGDRIRGLVMVGPDETGSLEFRIMEILGFNPKDHIFAVSDALASAAGVPVMFLHGEKDTTSSAPALVAGASEPRKITIVSGADHHFAGQEELLRNALIEGLDWIRSQKRPAPSPDPNHP